MLYRKKTDGGLKVYKMKIEKTGNRYRVKHEIGFYLYGNTRKEILHKIAILENMKNKGGIKEGDAYGLLCLR